MLAIEVLMSSGSVDTVCNLRLINVILCLDLESRISFVTHRHSAGDHSHQSPKLQCQRPRFSVLCCQGRMSISLIPGLPAIPRHCHCRSWLWKVRQRELCSPSSPGSATVRWEQFQGSFSVSFYLTKVNKDANLPRLQKFYYSIL